jgi:hypothetical protein
MKLNLDNAAGLASAAASGAAQTPEVDKASRERSGPLRAGSEPDRVDLSGLSAQIAEAGRAHAAQGARRVQELTALYQAGRYAADPNEVSRKIVEQMLPGASPTDSE